MEKKLFFVVLFLTIVTNINSEDWDNVIEHGQKVFSYADKQSTISKDQVLPFRGKAVLEVDVEPYQVIQLMLEKIWDELSLNNNTNSEERDVLSKLKNDPVIQNMIEKCKEFQSKVPDCDFASPYRTLDGTCNNVKYPKWGSALSPNVRMLPAVYDSVYGLRKSVFGDDLLDPRSLTLGLLKDEDHPTEDVSHLFVLFGQILDHEITNTPLTSINGSRPDCCGSSVDKSQVCSPISISSTDPFYSKTKKRCIQFARSAPYPLCSFDMRIPLNKVTSFIDASVVYGPSKEVSEKLRAFDGSGKLRSQQSDVGELLPKINKKDDVCPPKNYSLCFEAGDDRVNEQTILTNLQTLFLREHNRIADTLHRLNPHWDEETLFQESRRILIAEMQNIVCNEFFPPLLSPYYMRKFRICQEYDDSIEPGVLIEFSTAAFRLHSMIAHHFNTHVPGHSFKRLFSNPMIVHHCPMKNMLYQASIVPAQKNDHHLITDLKDFLYKFPYENIGIDLPTINIQRGRDHGLAPYTAYAEKCTLLKISDFADLGPFMSEENIYLLQKFYKHVNDIDLWIGLLMENAVIGSVFGPTSVCIVANQFHRVTTGDRFFFTNENQPSSFTPDQIETLKTSSLSQMICDNTEAKYILQYPLLLLSEENQRVPCNSIATPDLTKWKDPSG